MTNTTPHIAPNTKGWKIRTVDGFVPFGGIAYMGRKNIFKLTFDDGSSIGASAGHFFFTEDGRDIAVGELNVGITLIGIPNKTVTAIEEVGEEDVYDVFDSSTQTFLANGLLSHNCRFISNDPLLIDALVLENLTEQTRHIKPVGMAGDIVFFKQPASQKTYIVGMDVATGAENDYTAITCWEFPSLEQVAEFRSNTTSSVVSYQLLKRLFKIIERAGGMTYYSVENNGVGEAILALLEADEFPVDSAELVSEEGQKRLGMTTTVRSKVRSCLLLKELVERAGIGIQSKSLVEELKAFIRKGGSYAAKPGASDDMVMATIIALRVVESMASYDQDAYDKMYTQALTATDEWSDCGDEDALFGTVVV